MQVYGVGIKRQLMQLCRKMPCSLLGLVSREIQQWVAFSGARDLTNSGQDEQTSLRLCPCQQALDLNLCQVFENESLHITVQFLNAPPCFGIELTSDKSHSEGSRKQKVFVLCQIVGIPALFLLNSTVFCLASSDCIEVLASSAQVRNKELWLYNKLQGHPGRTPGSVDIKHLPTRFVVLSPGVSHLVLP